MTDVENNGHKRDLLAGEGGKMHQHGETKEGRKAPPTIESVKHILKLISNLPPPLLPRVQGYTPVPPPIDINRITEHPTGHRSTVSISEKPVEVKREGSVSPQAPKRKREDDEPPAPPTAVNPEEIESSPPVKKLRMNNGVAFDGSPIPAVRVAGVTFASPSVPPSTPDSNGRQHAAGGFDVPKRRHKSQLVAMRDALVKHIRQSKKSADHLWEDSLYLETAIPGSPPSNDPPFSSLLQKTDSILFALSALWGEEEHMSVENEIWRSYGEAFLEYGEWKAKRETDAYLPCARYLGAGRWNRFIQRAQEVLRAWEQYAASPPNTGTAASGSGGPSSTSINSGIALTHWILASAHNWCAESHIRHAAQVSRQAYKDGGLGELRVGEYDYLQDRGWRNTLKVPKSVPRSISAARFHTERSGVYLDRARGALLAPDFLATNFPKTWENCSRSLTRHEASEQPTPPHAASAFNPWSSDPLATYKVPTQAAGDAFSFQWPIDLRSPATHFCAFGRSLLYEIGSGAWPGCDASTRPFGLGVCFSREREREVGGGLPGHSLWR